MEMSFNGDTAEGSVETVSTTETIRIGPSVGASAVVEVRAVDLGAAAIAVQVDTEGKK